MARKLYISKVSAKAKSAGVKSQKTTGAFSTSYSYLGDFEARLLGLNAYTARKRMPKWLHTVSEPLRMFKGAARRLDSNFGDWGGAI